MLSNYYKRNKNTKVTSNWFFLSTHINIRKIRAVSQPYFICIQHLGIYNNNIIIFVYSNGVVTRWQWVFYM